MMKKKNSEKLDSLIEILIKKGVICRNDLEDKEIITQVPHKDNSITIYKNKGDN